MPTLRSHRLTIGAHRLRTRGTRHATTLLAGYDLAVHLLNTAQPVQPNLILLDPHAEEPGFPELAAPQFAAVLAAQMHRSEIHPAWLIGLAAGPTSDGDAEAYLAGCHLVLHLPLGEMLRMGLQRLAELPAGLPPTDRLTQVYQRAAARVLDAVQAAQITLWTVDDVEILLGYLTRYPVSEASSGQTKRVLRMLGGYDAAVQRLYAIAEAWRTRFPLYAEILVLFLNGANRREIVHFFVSRQLYEDSRIYACIKRLPERIAQELRLPQSASDPSLD